MLAFFTKFPHSFLRPQNHVAHSNYYPPSSILDGEEIYVLSSASLALWKPPFTMAVAKYVSSRSPYADHHLFFALFLPLFSRRKGEICSTVSFTSFSLVPYRSTPYPRQQTIHIHNRPIEFDDNDRHPTVFQLFYLLYKPQRFSLPTNR